MFAIQIRDYGAVDVFEEVETPRPKIKPKQVLVKQHAVAIDPYDVKFRQGLMGGKDQQPPIVTGSSVAGGEVVAVGDKVQAFKVGDRVAASPHLRSYAEYVAVGQSQLAQIPATVSYELAAAAALGVQTAYQLTEKVLELHPVKACWSMEGQEVLVLPFYNSLSIMEFMICIQLRVGKA